MDIDAVLKDLIPWAPAFGLLIIGALILASQVFRKNPFSVGLLISALSWVWLRSATDYSFTGIEKWIALYAQYVALAFLPPFWVGTCVSFTGRALRAARGALIALFSVGLVFAVIIATLPATGLFFRYVTLPPGSRLFSRRPGVAYYPAMIYLFGSIAAGVVYVARNGKTLTALDKRRAVLILIAVVAPVSAGIVDLFTAFPSKEVSFASIAILFSVAVLVYGVASSRLMSPVPRVHRTIVDEMAEPVFACDGKSRIIYSNAAGTALSPGGSIQPRASLGSVFPEIAEIERRGESIGGADVKIRGVQYRVSAKCVTNDTSESGTTVFVLHDVSLIVAEKSRLEELVAERTSLLNTANASLEIEVRRYRDSQIELEKLVKQKESLLQEINHRVKNNLQIVMSLMRLQDRRFAGNDELRAAFDAMASRIASISLVHERLYKTSFYESLDFGEYVTELVGGIDAMYSQIGSRTNVDIRAGKVEVSVDFCVEFGLVLNELMTNAYKHGIIPMGGGTVCVGLRRENGTLVLSVADTGPGFPADGIEPDRKSLGLSIVGSILPKYKASLRKENRGGALVEVLIPWKE